MTPQAIHAAMQHIAATALAKAEQATEELAGGCQSDSQNGLAGGMIIARESLEASLKLIEAALALHQTRGL